MRETTFGVKGMTCGHCAATVTKALLATPAVREARVDLEAATATVTVADEAGLSAARAAIEAAGYEVVDGH